MSWCKTNAHVNDVRRALREAAQLLLLLKVLLRMLMCTNCVIISSRRVARHSCPFVCYLLAVNDWYSTVYRGLATVWPNVTSPQRQQQQQQQQQQQRQQPRCVASPIHRFAESNRTTLMILINNSAVRYQAALMERGQRKDRMKRTKEWNNVIPIKEN